MKAIIFDMDGVVLDTEKHWDNVEFELIKKLLPHWTKKMHREKVVGMNIHDQYKILAKEGLKESEEKYTQRIDRLAKNIYRTKAELMPGFLDLKKEIERQKIPVGLATSSRFTWIEIALAKFDLENFFDSITSSQEIKGQGKPAPDIYLLAAKKLGLPPKDCVAVEDSANGVRSAKAAGCFTIGFRYGGNDDQDHSVADMDIRGFTPRNSQKILNLFK